MRWSLALWLVLAGCTEHGKGGGNSWDVREEQFAEAFCQNACVPVEDQADCLEDVLADMAQARAELSDDAEAACIECMRVKTELMAEIVAMGCQSSAEIDQQVVEACDSDPLFDFDGDGVPMNDSEEACVGFP
jgi:hypothetical protein